MIYFLRINKRETINIVEHNNYFLRRFSLPKITVPDGSEPD